MPSCSSRRQMLKAMPMADSTEDDNDHVWILSDADEHSAEIHYVPGPLSKRPSRKSSRSNLKISTLSQPDPLERYASSEEEPSPSPVSDTASVCGEDDTDERTQDQEEENEIQFEEKYEQHTEEFKAEIAIAVPIMAIGRPKLIDIANLAPMHKRKRSNSDKISLARILAKNAIEQTATMPKENVAPSTEQSDAETSPLDSIRTKTSQTPGSWPVDEENESVAEEDKDYFRSCNISSLPCNLTPLTSRPGLSPSNSYTAPTKKPGSVARARKLARNSSTNSTPMLRSLAKSAVSIKESEAVKPIRQLNKKPKMLPRGPTERSGRSLAPPSPI